ncbi:hypothetical protein [Serratia quinivorans]|uniref:hypothetical protein n=1 Tax=Serratia quinivorans TaxID=137545 RepID=UPI0021BDCD99|nr:hypothetical protein [Serratia quinivorans]
MAGGRWPDGNDADGGALQSGSAHVCADGDVGWIPQVVLCDLPAMFWRFLTGDDSRNYYWGIFLLLPAFFFGLSALLLVSRGVENKFKLLQLSGVFVPVLLLFAVSWRMPLFVDRYFFCCVRYPNHFGDPDCRK